MYSLITVCFYIGNFNAGTPNYHHCLLSSNLLSVLKGREECSVISLCMHTYWIILILTLISTLNLTLNVPIYKFKYQSMIIMQTIICLIIMQILYSYQIVTLMHNTVVYMYLHSYKINNRICNYKYQKKP